MDKLATVGVLAKINFTKRFLLTICAMFIMSYSFAVNRTSNGTGDWNTATTWNPNGIPGLDDDITIQAGHVITVSANSICRRLYVSGTLNMATTGGITMNITCNNNAGSSNGLQLNSGGTFNTGAASNILLFSYSQSQGIVNNGGTFTPIGTIRVTTGGGGSFGISGTSATTVNNIDFLANANFSVTTAGFRIDGMVSIRDNNWNANGSSVSPIYGPASTLYMDANNNGFSSNASPYSPLKSDWSKMWNQTTGTVGTTPGYPNNVTMVNFGSSVTNGTGWHPTGAVGLGGILQVGDGTKNGRITLEDVTSFDCGGIIVNNNNAFSSGTSPSLFIGPKLTFTNRGDFKLIGTPAGSPGTFQNSAGGIMNLNGARPVGNPQIISTTGTNVTFSNLQVSTGTYVTLQSPVNITNQLTFSGSGGYIRSSNTNKLTISNSATNAIVGFGATAYVTGPLTWDIPATTTASYTFPIGDVDNAKYLPLTILPSTTSGALTTATAFGIGAPSGASSGTIGMTLSNTEYWSVSTSPAFTSGPLVNATRPTPVSPYNALATSTAANGIYYAVGGLPSGNSINGGGIGTGSPVYILMVTAPLSVVKLSGVNAGCNGTKGTLKVGGSGGTAPYRFRNSGSGAYEAAGVNEFTNLDPGDYTIWVRDNAGVEASAILKVLGSVVINGDNKDVITCYPSAVTLKATNLQNTTPVFEWSLNSTGTPVAYTGSDYLLNPPPGNGSTPTTTTYYVKSNLYATNMLTDGSFETGTINSPDHPTVTPPSTELKDPALVSGLPYASTPAPDNVGYFMISNAGTNQCSWFSSNGAQNGPALAAQQGTKYLIVDGPTNAAKNAWTETVNVTDVGVYKFQYWYAAGNVNPNRAQIQTLVSGPAGTTLAAVGTSTTAAFYTKAKDASDTNGDPTVWVQATYTVTVTNPGNVTLTVRNTGAKTNFGSSDGNDFFLDNIEFLKPCPVMSEIKVISDCSLPVELTYFDVVKQGNGAYLTWATASELNSSHFVIEKSADGITFEGIGTVNAAGNSSTLIRYDFNDPSIYNGVTYYRLAQYDIDGTVHYSQIKSVHKDGIDEVLVIPNPNNGNFTVTLGRSGDVKSSINILNVLGQVVYTQGESVGSVKNVDISYLAAGTYYVQINTAQETVVKKIIKE